MNKFSKKLLFLSIVSFGTYWSSYAPYYFNTQTGEYIQAEEPKRGFMGKRPKYSPWKIITKEQYEQGKNKTASQTKTKPNTGPKAVDIYRYRQRGLPRIGR